MNNLKKSIQAAKIAYTALDEKKGIDIVILDISEVSIISDYFVIASGSNSNQLKAMADEVEENLYKAGFKLNHIEGFQSQNWILLDFGDIIVHLFDKESRDFYNIERIWADAKKIDIDELKN